MPACPHRRTRVIAEDDAVTYVECLDCGEVFETSELKQPPAGDAPGRAEFDEDLSDA